MKLTSESMEAELNSDGILTISAPKDFKGRETLEHAQENIQMFASIEPGLVKGIIGLLPSHYIDSKATRYYKEFRPSLPVALISDSAIKTMMGNLLLAMSNNSAPMKLFSNKDDGMAWLLSMANRLK